MQKNPKNNGIFSISTGAGFLPSTVSFHIIVMFVVCFSLITCFVLFSLINIQRGRWIYSFADDICGNWRYTSSNPVFKRAAKKKLLQQKSEGCLWISIFNVTNLFAIWISIESTCGHPFHSSAFYQPSGPSGPQLSLDVYILIIHIQYQKSNIKIYQYVSIYQYTSYVYIIYHETFRLPSPKTLPKKELQVPKPKKKKTSQKYHKNKNLKV